MNKKNECLYKSADVLFRNVNDELFNGVMYVIVFGKGIHHLGSGVSGTFDCIENVNFLCCIHLKKHKMENIVY